jgi:hypothetical protein
MNHTVPRYLTPFILTGMVAIIAAVSFGLSRALRGADWSQKERTTVFWSVVAILVGWFAVAYATSVAGFYRPASGPPTIQYGLLTPIVAGMLLFLSWPLLHRTVALIPNTWLVGVQFYRVLGVIFLLLYAGGHLPGLFALPAGIGDVLVGILAPFVAGAYARSPETAAWRVRLWNLLGISDLVIAVTMGFLTSPSPLQVAAFDRPSTLIGMFPLVLIPVFAVPLSILLHFASLRTLRQEQFAGDKPQVREQLGSSARRAIG